MDCKCYLLDMTTDKSIGSHKFYFTTFTLFLYLVILKVLSLDLNHQLLRNRQRQAHFKPTESVALGQSTRICVLPSPLNDFDLKLENHWASLNTHGRRIKWRRKRKRRSSCINDNLMWTRYYIRDLTYVFGFTIVLQGSYCYLNLTSKVNLIQVEINLKTPFHFSKNTDVFLILCFINFQGKKIIENFKSLQNRKAEASTDVNTFSGLFWAVKFL